MFLGTRPFVGLIFDSKGALYGTTYFLRLHSVQGSETSQRLPFQMRIQSQIMAQFSPARIENRGSYLAMAQDRSGQIARTRISMQPGMCFGIVLAGGLSRRMGGGDKALRELGGTSLLARVIAAVRPQCEGLVLSANGDPARLAMFDFPVIADDVQGFKDRRASPGCGICNQRGGRYAVPAGRSYRPPQGRAGQKQRHGCLRALGRADASFGHALAGRDQAGTAPSFR